MVTLLVKFFFIVSGFLLVECASSPIWTGPAPPPDEGPPLSASAVRDLSLLWREIAGIVGAYVVSVCILLGCLLTVGRRLRRSAQESNPTLEIEMFKPSAQPANEPHPKSAGLPPNEGGTSPTKSKGRSFSSFSRRWSNNNSRGPASPVSRNDSMSTVDESVVQADRQKAQIEMERLYAAVMEHDAQQSTAVYDASDGEGRTPTSARHSRSQADVYPEFKHLRQRQHPISPVSAKSPGSPLSPKAIPEEHLQSHQNHQPVHSPQEESAPVQSPKSPFSDRLSRISSFSFFSSSKSRDPTPSPKKLRRHSVRRLPISPPLANTQSPGQSEQSPYAENQPLSPRIYHPGPPPLNPHQRASASPGQAVSPSDSSRPPPVAPSPLSQRPTGSSTSSLPFRAAFSPPQSPSTKTTVVEWRQSSLGRSAPRTGVPRTPYSPYMPFSPITPITPSRIVTRDQRKQRDKENGPRVMTEEDMVVSDEDMWGA